MLKSELTTHLLIVEIKTPATQLLGQTAYRPPDVYAVSRDVAGAVTQIGRYREEFLANYGNLRVKSEENVLLADPRCLVVIGCTDQLDDRGRKDSFEQFRFDELFRKIELLLNVLEGRV